MKTTKLVINTYKDTSLSEIAFELFFDKFKSEHSNLEEDELNDKFYNDVVSKIFEWGEYVNLEIEIDENLNVVGGRLIPFENII